MSEGEARATILLLVDRKRDRNLLRETLAAEYEVVTTAEGPEPRFDLCVLDERSLRRHREALERWKETVHPEYLPYLLVAFEFEPSEVPQRVWSTVDELVTTPIAPAELENRIERLLETRSMSLELERQRDRSERRFETLFDDVPDPIAVVDDDETVVDVNDAFVELFEIPRSDAIDRPFEAVAHWESDDGEASVERLLSGSEGEKGTVRCPSPSGDELLVELHVDVVDHGDGHPERVVVFRDVTERERRERELQREQELTQTVIDALPDVFFVIGEDGTFDRWNERLPEVTGYADAELGDMHPLALADPDHDEFGDVLGSIEDVEFGTTIERNLVTRSGDVVPYEAIYAPLRHDDGTFFGLAGIARDISDRKARERELEAQNERLDQFASVVSHDLRNPLSVAEGELDRALAEYDDEALERVSEAIERMRELVDELLVLARQGETVDDPTAVSIGVVAKRAWKQVETGDAALELDLSFDWTVRADADRLQQLFENCFRNAVEHGGDAVTVTVERTGGGFAVADDGEGFDEEPDDDLFEHGYTTAEDGTGFGLSIVASIAEAHDWGVDAASGTDGGARFEFSGVESI